MKASQPVELHSFADDRPDDGTHRWGVWPHESCAVCGRRLIVVAPIDRQPDMVLCSRCDPLARQHGEVAC